MAEAMSESQSLISDVIGFGSTGTQNPANDPVAASKALSKVGRSLLAHPDRLANANAELMRGWFELFQGFMTGNLDEAERDRRFSDPEWSENPMFDFMRRAYKLNSDWMMALVDSATELEEADRRKAKYYGRLTVDAFAPTNFFASNPTALKAMLESGGSSVVEGLRQARTDIKRGGGKLSISQTDETPFEVGKNIATAPGKVVFRNDLIELIQYAPTKKKTRERPLLIFPPWINKFYILDLREENSMIRWLVNKGLTVLVVSWRSADDVTKDYTWDDYVEKGIHAALDAALEATGAEDLNTVGYCIGGSLLSGTLARMAQTDDTRIASATFFASQSDFEKAGELLIFTDGEAQQTISTIIDEHDGIMPGEYMAETFNWLRPVDLVWRYVVDNYMMGKKPRPFDLLYWNADQTNIPGPTHRTYIQRFYGENALAKGEFEILGERVDLSDVKIPVFVQCSRDDHICPYESVYRTAKVFGGDTTFVMAGSGHIAGVVNHPDANKYQHWVRKDLPGDADEWLGDAEEIPGSWWPTWWKWLKKNSGEKIPAIEPKDCGLGDAPGTYVKSRLEDIAQERKKAGKAKSTAGKKASAKRRKATAKA
ncbi:MAG: class I poly(R)-hydroxyalkanoic acid synthase [Pseudomonadota bacterium]